MLRYSRWVPSALMLTALAGCNDINPGQDQRTGRGAGDQVPNQGPASQGTNATATEVTLEGPGSPKIIKKDTADKSGGSTPYGGDGMGASPPVSPGKGGLPSGDSNSGQLSGKQNSVGSDASGNDTKPNANLGGPGTGAPPK